jgi:hypothetical protein
MKSTRDENEALEKAKDKFGKKVEIYQEPDVLDMCSQ